MKKLSAISCALVFTSSAAIAADVPATKPSSSTRVATPSWTGFYAGAFGGYGRNSFEANQLKIVSVVVPGSAQAESKGFQYGAQVGADYELPNRIVVGVAADATRVHASNGSLTTTFFVGSPFIVTGKNSTLWTVRARVGTVFDNVMLYGTGGLAAAKSELSVAEGIGSSPRLPHSGWVAGAGAEFRLLDHWRLGLEYRYVDLGEKDYCFNQTDLCAAFKWKSQQGFVSLNYQF
jgi:opacity protein-like surface antigen